MKALLIATALLTAAMAAPVATQAPTAASATGARATVTVNFTGIETRSGTINAAVYDTAEAYAGHGRPIRQVQVNVTGGEASVAIGGLAPGRYAIKAFHDLDGDGQMDTNPFGMPTEPFAFSNGATVNMGPPNFDAAAFTVTAGANAQAITIR